MKLIINLLEFNAFIVLKKFMKKKLLIILFFVFLVNSFNLTAVAKNKETYEYLSYHNSIIDFDIHFPVYFLAFKWRWRLPAR